MDVIKKMLGINGDGAGVPEKDASIFDKNGKG